MDLQDAYRRIHQGVTGDGPLSRIGPLTLLAGCGIALAAALLIVTGLVVGYLHARTLEASEAGLSRVGAVLVGTGNRSLLAVEAVLSDTASRIRIADPATADDTARDIAGATVAAQLAHRAEAAPMIVGIALIAVDGTVVSRTGGWAAGDINVAARDYFQMLQADNRGETVIGAPIALEHDRATVIPVAHRLRSASGAFAGAAVATISVSDFEELYRVVPLGDDGVISLIRRDGTVLAQYPHQQPGSSEPSVVSPTVLAALADGAQGVFEEDRDAEGQWRMHAIQPVGDYPVSVVVSRRGDQALIGWSRQAAMFGAFAVSGVAAIAMVGFLIARQFQTHSALAAIRAEKIEAEHARLVAEAELIKKERFSVLGQFTATVATELRNPLSAIRNTLFTMREIATTSGLVLDRPIARIQRSIARCDRIIGDLLEYTRAPELTRVPVAFDRWLHDVLADHSLPANVTVVEELEADDAIVRIDADRVRRVVINLIDNAVQALGETPHDGLQPCITVHSGVRDRGLELVVEDTGPGIPHENIARIFEPLFSTKSFGTGLGLATVKQIVSQHNGTIRVDSKIGRGTRITIRLPLEPEMRAAA